MFCFDPFLAPRISVLFAYKTPGLFIINSIWAVSSKQNKGRNHCKWFIFDVRKRRKSYTGFLGISLKRGRRATLLFFSAFLLICCMAKKKEKAQCFLREKGFFFSLIISCLFSVINCLDTVLLKSISKLSPPKLKVKEPCGFLRNACSMSRLVTPMGLGDDPCTNK